MSKCIAISLFGLILASVFPYDARASLLGQTVFCGEEAEFPFSVHCRGSEGFSNGQAIVDDDIEFSLRVEQRVGGQDEIIGTLKIDVDDTSFTAFDFFFDEGFSAFGFSLHNLVWTENPTVGIEEIVISSSEGISDVTISTTAIGNSATVFFETASTWPDGAFVTFLIVPEPHVAVPEPSTPMLFAIGLVLVLWWARRVRSVDRCARQRP